MKQGSGPKWTSLSRDDLIQARTALRQQRVELETRHGEELQAITDRHSRERQELEAKEAKIDDLESVLEAFAAEYLQSEPAAEQQSPTELPITLH